MRNVLLWLTAVIFLAMGPSATVALAAEDSYADEKYLSISTSENRPLAVDRLVYNAFRDIGYTSVFTTDSLQAGYEAAAEGEKDGVISSTPNLLELYPDLRQVPVPIEQTNVFAFVSAGSNRTINDWNDLSGLKLGIMEQRYYILSQIPHGAEVVYAETSKQLLNLVIQGEIDAAVFEQRANEVINLPAGVANAGKLVVLHEYLYLHKSREYLLPQITEALEQMLSDGRAGMILSDIPLPEAANNKTVLHVISSNAEVMREDKFIAGLKESFKDDDSIEWYTATLNSRRFSGDPNRLTNIASLIRQDFASRNVAAIIVSGEEAIQFIEDHYFTLFRNVPILYYGMSSKSDPISDELKPYLSGIVETISANETAEEALRLFPDTGTIFVVNDYSSEGQAYREAAETQLKQLEGSVSIEYNENTSCQELMERLKSLPQNSLVLFGSYFRDAHGQYYSQNEMGRALKENCSVPIFSIYSNDLGYSAIGGKTPNYTAYGDTIATMLSQLLDGGSIGDIDIVTDSSAYNNWVFSKTEMDLWGIKEGSLPKNARIINKSPSIWESDPRFAFTLVALVVLGIAATIGVNMFLLKYRSQRERLNVAEELIKKDATVREVKERLERTISSAPIAYLVSIDGIIAELNESMKEYIGLDVGDHIAESYGDQAEREAFVESIMLEGIIRNRLVKVKCADNQIHRSLLSSARIDYQGKDAIVAWMVDIEQDQLQKDQLKTARENLQTILDVLPMSIRIIDVETDEILYVNNAAIELFEFDSIEEALGRSILTLMPPTQPDGENSIKKVKGLFNVEPTSAEIVYLRANGKRFDCLVTACLIDYNGRKSSLAIIEDLTAKKEYEQMLMSTAQKEKEANQLKGRFLVNMSHEIRTPMNAVIGLTEIELRKNPSKESEDVYRKINMSAKNLLQIINDILDLSKIEADKMEIYDDEFELEDAISSALLVSTPRLDGKNVEFMLNASLDLPRYVIGDRTRVWQVLKNFLDNAAKYTESGKIMLSVFVDNYRSNEEIVYIKFIIEDTGIGMDDDQIKRIFMPYEQVYNEAQRKYTGTGLGMVISKQLCEIMGGELQVESAVGVGTNVYITLPFKRSANDQTELEAVKAEQLSGIDVLAVDDDEVSLWIMDSLLKGSDANCEIARSGEEAMQIILDRRDRGKSFDLILLDYMMDGLNGLETARQIQMSLSRAPKLLMVTAYQRMLLKEELEENGIDDMIEKPFIPSQFMQKITTALGYAEDAGSQAEEVLTKFAGVHVLLCEDYRLNQEVATGMLAEFGITTTVAEDGLAGLEMLNSGKEFDLIFMDLQMPVLDGYDAARIIRSDLRFDDLPIISLTADAMKESVDKCLEIGMNDHIAKPIDFSSLNKILRKWLPESKRLSEGMAPMPIASDPQSEALARFGGNKELYEGALREFANILPDDWPEFSQAVADMDETKRNVHRLKGAAGNLSEMDIYQSSIDFESSLRINKPDIEAYQRLISASESFKQRISERSLGDASLPSQLGSLSELKKMLQNLSEALQNYNPKTSSGIVRQMKKISWPEAFEAELNHLYELTLRYEFDAALDVLEEIREGIR